jgi:cytochrome c peroxidase
MSFLRRLLAAAPAAILLLATAGNAAAETSFTEDEIALILAQGPWPVETVRDPSNRLSGNPDAIAYGRLLFESTSLSKDRDRSCAACHREAEGFGDGLPRGIGIARVDRNTPPLYNLRLNRWFGWDGKSDSLWAQSIPPILDARELALTPEELRRRIAGTPELAAPYRRIFGTEPAASEPEALLADIGKALAAFQETIVSGKSAFDRFRDALEARDATGIAAYPDDAKRGLRMFVGRGQCVLCHFGPNFTSGEFHDIGLPHMAAPGRVDPGRYGGIKLLRANPFNLLGRHNDDPGRTTAGFTRHVHLSQRNWGEFRIPSLRNVALTAPYMHDGSKATLEDAVRHYSEIDESRLHQDGEKLLKPLKLSDTEIADMVAFLKTL